MFCVNDGRVHLACGILASYGGGRGGVTCDQVTISTNRHPVTTYYVALPKIELRPYLRRNFLGFQGIISANVE